MIRYRRMLGLFAFFYATACTSLTYLVLDQGLALRFILADVAKRPFITAGMVAFLLMCRWRSTSTKGWIRRLGRRWQVLHRLVYVSARSRGAAFHLEGQGGRSGEPVYYAVAAGHPPGVPAALAAPAGVSRPTPTRSGITS